MSAYRFEEHTGEVRLKLEAGDRAALFAEAARALAELMCDGPLGAPAEETQEELSIQAPDREALLVEWIDELIFRSETRKKIYAEVAVLRASDTELVAIIRGFEPERIKTAVKAATFHDLVFAEREGRWVAQVVLDV